MTRTAAALIALLLTACGDDPAPKPAVPAWAKVAPEQIAEAKKHGVPVAFENDLGMRFVLIPAGTFMFGREWPVDHWENDLLSHEATVERPYYMQTTEVTNEQFRTWKPRHDSGLFRDRLALNNPSQPVCRVSWENAMEFCAWLSESDTHRVYALPTELEWERACRAASSELYYWGEDFTGARQHENLWDSTANADVILMYERSPFAWEDGHVVTAPVASFKASGWGLYDMIGNLGEWCQERDVRRWKEPESEEHTPLGQNRMVRGASWFQGAHSFIGCSARGSWHPSSNEFETVGFRLVSPLPEPGE